MKSWPWDARVMSWGEDGLPVYDRGYTADELRSVLGRFYCNGVFTDVPGALRVQAGSNMTVKVSAGDCVVRGTYGWEESERSLEITSASSQDRIDTVVLRWNNEVEKRTIDLYVVRGTAAATPTRPALTRTETVYELGIADIFVPKNSTSISNSRITDTRLETGRCGVALPFAQFDTTSFSNYMNGSITDAVEELQEQTQTAVDLAQSALDGTTAGNLQNQINALETTLDTTAQNLDESKVSKSGDTMTGDLVVNGNATFKSLATVNPGKISRETLLQLIKTTNSDKQLQLMFGINSENEQGTITVRNSTDGTLDNYMALNKDFTSFGKPISKGSGGTGSSTPMEDFVIASGKGNYGSGNQYTPNCSWVKFNNGLAIVTFYKPFTTTGSNTRIDYQFPFGLYSTSGGTFPGIGVTAKVDGYVPLWIGYTDFNLTSAESRTYSGYTYVCGANAGKSAAIFAVIVGRWKA